MDGIGDSLRIKPGNIDDIPDRRHHIEIRLCCFFVGDESASVVSSQLEHAGIGCAVTISIDKGAKDAVSAARFGPYDLGQAALLGEIRQCIAAGIR